MAEIGKFIFTNEGKRMIIAQTGGIHFAIMGAILLTRGFDDEEVRDITWEELKSGKYGTLGLKGISYVAGSGENAEIITSDSNYENAINNILARDTTKSSTYLFDTTYTPDMGVVDKENNVYGLYTFTFDKTKFTCVGEPTFRSIVLIGKQYVTEANVRYSVEETQNPSVVGLLTTGIDGSAIADFCNDDLGEGNDNRNKFTEFKLEWRVTITDNPITDVGEEIVETLSEINKKFALTNDGVKTKTQVKLTVDDKEIYQFDLNKEGNWATSKSVMIQDTNMADQDEANQWNSPGLLHLINKHEVSSPAAALQPCDSEAYKPQQIISTFKYDTENSLLETQHVRQTLTASNDIAVSIKGFDGTYKTDPTYTIDALSDDLSTNIFGTENSSYNGSNAKFLFSNKNEVLQDNDKTDNSPSIFIGSDNNIEENCTYDIHINSYNDYLFNSEGVINLNTNDNFTDNLCYGIFINSNGSKVCQNEDNTYTPYRLSFLNATDTTAYGSEYTTFVNSVGSYSLKGTNSTFINSVDCEAMPNPYKFDLEQEARNIVFLNGYGLKGIARTNYHDRWDRQVILGMYNATMTNYKINDITNPGDYDPVESMFTIGAGWDDVYRRNALEFNFHNYIYDGDNNTVGWEGELTVDYLNVRKDMTATRIEAGQANIDDVTATNLNVANNLTTNAINTTNLTIAGKTIDNYVETSVTTDIDSNYIINKLKNKDIELEDATIRAKNIKIKELPRKYTAHIIYKNTSNSDIKTAKFDIEYETDTGGLSDSPMSRSLKAWIEHGIMFGYSDGDHSPGEYTYYWRGNSMVKAENINIEHYPAASTDEIVMPMFWGGATQNPNYEYPMSLSYIPAGYDEIEINIYFKNVGSSDIVFPMVACIKRRQFTKVRVNLILADNDDESEDVHFWETKNWKNPGENVWEDLEGANPRCDFVDLHEYTLNKSKALCLEAIACPRTYQFEGGFDGNYSDLTQILGWRIVSDWH